MDLRYFLPILICVPILFSTVNSDVNGGIPCAACTFVLGWAEQIAEVNEKSITSVLRELCNVLPEDGNLRGICKKIVWIVGPLAIRLLEENESADVACHAVNLCYTEPGQPQCNFWPLPEDGIEKRLWKKRNVIKHLQYKYGLDKLGEGKNVCDFPGIDKLCTLVERVSDHIPAVDVDNDNFSSVETLRGSNWRGRDCDDLSEGFYPGAKPQDNDEYSDSNCNGIYGVDETGLSYEEAYCSKSERRGIAVLGDSAAAHFHIPLEWIEASKVTKEAWEHAAYVIANEFDWPMTSAMTGFKNITWPIVHGETHSIYWQLRERNRCNHRDYQSLSVNGARSSSMQDIQLTLSRDQDNDYPLLVIYSLFGNDVCNGHVKDTIDHMTTPEEMEKNVKNTLSFLEGKIPSGSHVFMLGLADGRLLYESLHGRYHPLGELHKDATYDDFYDYLNCLDITPCSGWLNTNATIRELTAQRAGELNAVLEKVAKESSYTKFDTHYIDDPISTMFSQWEADHGEGSGWMVVEAVDGFHPNQIGQGEMGKFLWAYLQKELPDFIGPVNEFNDKIETLFGDQGGH